MKGRRHRHQGGPAIVAVISSASELATARRLRPQPDYFELRLDFFPTIQQEQLRGLRAPLIVTVRHPAEGGKKIPGRERLLMQFLPKAKALDLELRSLKELRAVWSAAGRHRLLRIASVHDFRRTPGLATLRRRMVHAKSADADILKIVTQVNDADDLLTLVELLDRATLPLCLMAVGKFGVVSRLLLPRCGSILLYAPVRRILYPGQLTFAQLRRKLHPRN